VLLGRRRRRRRRRSLFASVHPGPSLSGMGHKSFFLASMHLGPSLSGVGHKSFFFASVHPGPFLSGIGHKSFLILGREFINGSSKGRQESLHQWFILTSLEPA
jgi:hypothetical protein